MANPEVKELFYKTRFVGGWHLLAVVLYSPIGLMLALLRVFISLQAYLLAMLFSIQELSFMRQFVLRVMSLVLGIFVVEENPLQRDKSVKVLIANQTTILDHIPVHLLTGCFSPSQWDVWPLALKWFEGSTGDKTLLVASLRSHMHKTGSPLLLQPEEAVTNSRTALLRFSSWCLSVGPVVQPITLRAWRPLGVANSTLTATFGADLFWFLFTPVTVFRIRYLPVVQRGEGESEEEMADRVAKAIAQDLGLVATKFTVKDKCELEKRYRLELNRRSSPPRVVSPEAHRMAGQVAEVLPYVPYEAILRDISRTRSVDLTISNILEGHVRFTPVTEQPPIPTPTASSSLPTSSPSISSEASGSFPRSAQDRMMSFVERKARLIEDARKRYMEKHGLVDKK